MEDMMLNFDTTGSTIGPEPKKQKWEQHSGKTAAGTRGKMKYQQSVKLEMGWCQILEGLEGQLR